MVAPAAKRVKVSAGASKPLPRRQPTKTTREGGPTVPEERSGKEEEEKEQPSERPGSSSCLVVLAILLSLVATSSGRSFLGFFNLRHLQLV